MRFEFDRNFNKFKPENPLEDDYLTYSNLHFNGITRQPALESREHRKEDEFSLGLKVTEDNPMDFHEFNSNGSSDHEKRDSCCPDSSERTCPGVVWDVFRRQDIPKLNEFLKTHWKKLMNSSQSTDSVNQPFATTLCRLMYHVM